MNVIFNGAFLKSLSILSKDSRLCNKLCMGPEGGQGVWTPPRKSHVLICFLRNTGTDPLEKRLDPSGPTASRGGSYVPP